MTSYNNSIHALKVLVQPGSSERSGRSCCITKVSQDVSHLENGIEYCLVEVTCDDGEQYGIQAFGDEAVELHKEALEQNQPLSEERVIPLVL